MHRNKRCRKRIAAALLSAMVMMGNFAGTVPAVEVHAAETALTIPKSYSSVDLGYTPAVRSQGSYSNCWAHAALGSVEISMIKNKVAPAAEVDLSESHTVYYVYRPVADPLGGTIGDYTAVSGETVYTMFHTGNQISDTEEALLGWMGPVSEDDFFDYGYLVSNHNDVSSYEGLNDVEHAYGNRAATVVDSVIVRNNQEEMKRVIMDYGSVSISYNSNAAYFDYEHSSQYCGTSQSVTHAVTVVGWDDNFPKENFVTTPEGDGAWLVRNSWGAGHGINGYFWLSYYDKTISGGHGYRAVAPDKYDHNYRYDKGGTDNGYVNGVEKGNVEAANIFRIQNEKEILKAVQFGVQWINSNYSIQIYKNPTDASQPSTGEALLETPIQGTKALSGKYTVDLGKDIILEKDDVIAVAVTYSTNNPDGCPAAQTGNVGVCNPGESMYRVNGGEWKDCAGPAGRNFVIRAFTADVTEESESHTHDWSEDWSGNALAHWHDCEGSSECVYEEGKDYAVHTGGTATCKYGAICEICGQEYGVKNGELHEGSIVRKNAAPATTSLKGYTGDLCCSGCDVILERGEEIPVLTGEEEPSEGKSVPNLDYTFYTLDGEAVSTKAEGRPKLLIFYGAGCGHCINTLTSLTSKKLEGVDIVAVDINNSSIAKIQELQLRLGVGMEDIQFCYDLGMDAYGARIAYEKAFHGMTYSSVPVICYIDANDQIKLITSGTQTLNEIKSNLSIYCGLKTTNLNKNNPSNATFTSLDGDQVTMMADGKPKVLVFFDKLEYSWKTLESLSSENIEGADILAFDVWGQGEDSTREFVDAHFDSGSDIKVVPDSMSLFEMFAYTDAIGETNGITYPVIAYIDADNKLQHVTMGKSSISEVRINLEANCGFIEGEKFPVVPEPEPEPAKPVTEVFADVFEAWYTSAVQYVYDKGIIVGDGNLFMPDNATTRAMFVVMLHRMENSPKVTDYTKYDQLTDLCGTREWYSEAIAWALNEGLTTGDTVLNLYNPNAPTTREQLALFFWRYAQYKGENVTVNRDADEILGGTYVNDWAKDGFIWAVDSGLIKGSESLGADGQIQYDLIPQGSATRAQLATVLQRFLEERN